MKFLWNSFRPFQFYLEQNQCNYYVIIIRGKTRTIGVEKIFIIEWQQHSSEINEWFNKYHRNNKSKWFNDHYIIQCHRLKLLIIEQRDNLFDFLIWFCCLNFLIRVEMCQLYEKCNKYRYLFQQQTIELIKNKMEK